jgi:hypothetical protein
MGRLPESWEPAWQVASTQSSSVGQSVSVSQPPAGSSHPAQPAMEKDKAKKPKTPKAPVRRNFIVHSIQ